MITFNKLRRLLCWSLIAVGALPRAFAAEDVSSDLAFFQQDLAAIMSFNQNQGKMLLGRLHQSRAEQFPVVERSLEKCCVCFADHRDGSMEAKYFGTVCRKWFKEQTPFCAPDRNFIVPHHFVQHFPDVQSLYETPLPRSCSEVRAFGAFHGSSTDSEVPLLLSKALSLRLHSRDVCYDGLSCLVFNDVAAVKAQAQLLTEDSCHYDISGNQNVGVGTGLAFLPFGGREIKEAASRVRVKVGHGRSPQMTFHECSAAGSFCGYVDPRKIYYGPNDPAKKECIWGGKRTHQTCCKGNRWSNPGESCQNRE